MNASELAYFIRRGYGPIYGSTDLVASGSSRRSGQSFGLDDHLDLVSDDLGDLEDEVDELFGDSELFGIVPALIIGAASAAPAIAMAVKGKRKRLESLEKKLEKLKEKAEVSDGKKADRLEKRIGKIEARIEKLKGKLGGTSMDEGEDEDEEFGLFGIRRRHHRRERRRDRRQERRGTSFGLGPGLGSTYRFVPAELEEEEPMADLDGELFGSLPVELLGSHQLTSADAATVDEGTIVAVPVVADHPLHPHTNDAIRSGVSEFLAEYGRRRQGAHSRR